MKVTSTQEVHIRSGGAFRKDGNKKGVIYPGFEIDVSEVLKGEIIEGKDTWYKDRNGDYYWSGGFAGAAAPFDYGKSLKNIHALGVKGAGVKVAVIDSGIRSNLQSFNGHIHQELTQKFINDIQLFSSSEDTDGHGTAMASVISSVENFALAPHSELVICKVMKSGFVIQMENFLKALKWCIDEPDITIINCSLSFMEKTPEMESLIGKATDRNKIIVAATGLKQNNQFVGFPARFPIVLGLGAVDKFDMADHKNVLNDGLDFCAPGVGIETLTLSGNSTTAEKGSSIATAYFSGFAALCLSAYNRNFVGIPVNAVRWIFSETVSKIRATGKSEHGNGIIDPFATVEKIFNNT